MQGFYEKQYARILRETLGFYEKRYDFTRNARILREMLRFYEKQYTRILRETLWFYKKCYDFTRNAMILQETLWFYEKCYDFTRIAMISVKILCIVELWFWQFLTWFLCIAGTIHVQEIFRIFIFIIN